MAKLHRRQFFGVAAASTAAFRTIPGESSPTVLPKAIDQRPALLGGKPIRSNPFPSWPVVGSGDRQRLVDVFEHGHWNRGQQVERFEKEWARLLESRFAVATSSGTSALVASLAAMGIGPGDEVIVPPYTFVATVNVVLMAHALPVFVDSDRKTFQIDAAKIEPAVTSSTRCIIPVHLGGNVADMDRILELGKRRGVDILEDACQAHLAEWKGRKVGTLGRVGCFSFQASKNLNSGEGGALVTQDPETATLAASFHNAGRPYTVEAGDRLVAESYSGFAYVRNGDNRRLTEFQGALLNEQLTRLEDQTRTRETNARYLTAQLQEIPGIRPAEEYAGCTRNAYHLYMFRFDSRQFAGLSRRKFIQALEAEGIPCGGGYSPLNKEPFLGEILESRAFRKIYSEKELRDWMDRNQCPENDRLCEEAVWLTQTQLLGPRSDMDEISAAVRKIHENAAELAG